MAKSQVSLIPAERIERSILLIRGQKVLLDSDLASLYGVTTKRLNEQVKRNAERFPVDFMFQLNAEEYKALRSQLATLRPDGDIESIGPTCSRNTGRSWPRTC